MHAIPPETIENRTVVSEASRPASALPRDGPVPTTARLTPSMRPRISSGVTVFKIASR